MNYIWSKKSLLDFLYNSITSVVKRKDFVFSDLFAWTWIVWSFFKQKWNQIIANDIQYYSFVLNRNYIWNHKPIYFYWLESEIKNLSNFSKWEDRVKVILEYLNNLDWKKGFIYKNYAPGGSKWNEFERMYFTDENAKKCDAIRMKIEEWEKAKLITENEYYFLLASLLESIDKVANTASVYGAFLKKFKKSALKPLVLELAEFYLNDKEHQVFNEDINKLILNTSHDVVYLDPPYNHRQYSENYHLLETIVKYDNPQITWKTWMRVDPEKKSLFCSRAEVKKSFKFLMDNIKANYVFLSYNDEWLMSLDDIKEIMSSRWEYGVFRKEYRRFKADRDENRNHKKDSVIEYLHYVKLQ